MKALFFSLFAIGTLMVVSCGGNNSNKAADQPEAVVVEETAVETFVDTTAVPSDSVAVKPTPAKK